MNVALDLLQEETHKSGHIPNASMKSNSIIISTLTKCDKVLTCPGSYITMKLNVQITMCCMQLYISLLLWIPLDFHIFITIFCNWII